MLRHTGRKAQTIKKNGYASTVPCGNSFTPPNKKISVQSKKTRRSEDSLLAQCGTAPRSRNDISSITTSKPSFLKTLIQDLLELAVYFKANQCAFFLLEHGASAVATNEKTKRTPLECAFRTGNIELISEFLKQTDKKEFDNNFEKILKKQNYESAITQVLASPILHETNSIFAKSLTKAVEEKNTDLISKIFSFPRLSEKALLESLDTETKNKLLFLALDKNNTGVANSLIEAGASIFARNINNHTPLWHAIVRGQQETAILLIKKAIQNDPKKKAILKETLEHAIKQKQNAVINFILGQQLPSQEIETCLTNNYRKISEILQVTTGKNNSILASAFIRACLKSDTTSARLQENLQHLLSLVSTTEQSVIVEELISHFKSPENNDELSNITVDTNSTSLLIYIIQNDNTEAAELLINAGVNLSHTDDLKNTAMVIAIQRKNMKIIDLLIAKSDPSDLSGTEKENACAALTEAIKSDLDAAKKLLEILPHEFSDFEPIDEPAIKPSTLERHLLERPPFQRELKYYSVESLSDFVATALESAMPDANDVYLLFKFVLTQSKEKEKRNNAIALELARYLRKHHMQNSDDLLDHTDGEVLAANDPGLAFYLKEVDKFIMFKEPASKLVARLAQHLNPATK